MGLSLYVEGIQPPDDEYKRMMVELHDLCTRAKVTLPPEVAAFFKNTEPNEHGGTVDIDDAITSEEWGSAIVDLAKLPKIVKKIRIVVC
jgi:hypothetical protein